YLPALREVGMHKRRELQEEEGQKWKRGRWLCPESPSVLQMLRSNMQNQVKVLPDLPDLNKCPSMTMKMRLRPKNVKVEHKENCNHLAGSVDTWKRNLKGETALHIACRSNKVERLIQLLSSPGADINVTDYAGWTPLHEACNHGSTVCVREILQRCPEVDLLCQVDGVTPLHDALSNGHVEIAKLLLQHGGPSLLQQRDINEKLPLDHVESRQLKQELLDVVHSGEHQESFCQRMEQDFCSQQSELWLTLFSKMLLNFCSVYNLSSPITFRGAACSNVLPVMTPGNSKDRSTYSADWLVDLYVRELETFQKLPGYLQEISETVGLFPGDQMKALLATLQTMVEA
ncbi:Ankyrin repeat domain-containing protein 32, partial [Dryobates pubescens]